jgi:hypothetical protein
VTIPNLVFWLFTQTPVTAQRIRKAQREADRNGLVWDDVLAAMTDEQREAVTNAS